MITEDPVADNTDVYAFVAPDAPDHVTIVSNFIPFQEPAGGPNFYKFGRDVRYDISIDNDGDAVTDVRYEFRFRTVIKNPDTFLNNTGPITFVDGEYQNLNIQQMYTVTEVRNGRGRVLARDLLVPPNNIGPRSTPNYDELASAAIHEIRLDDGSTMKVFAGQRDDAFPVDLGSIFDLGGLRPFNPAHLVPLAEADGVNTTSGFNVHSIAIQVPTHHVTEGDEPVIGIHSTANRQQTRTLDDGRDDEPIHHSTSGDWVQVSRLGNPLVNEVIIPLAEKDLFNATEPKNDARFLEFVQDPILAGLLPVLYPDVFGECLPAAPRQDLVTIFLTGIPDLNQPDGVKPAELLRLNTSIAPTPLDQQDPMGLLAGQTDGFPNGRRLGDDVVDIALQAVAGATPLGECAGVAPNNALGDGVVGNDRGYLETFPYLPSPHQGYSHEHDHSQDVAVTPPPEGSDGGDPPPPPSDDGSDDAPTSMSRNDQVERLYWAYFLRPPDAAGLAHWVGTDLSIGAISQEFAKSQEFQDRYGTLTNRQFVERIYMNVLGRPGEAEGVNYWTSELDRGVPRGVVMIEFSNSAEFRAKVGAMA